MLELATSYITSGAVLASESGSDNGVFSGTLGDSLWTVVWFIVLLIVLKRFAWSHVLAGLKAREERIAKEINDAEKARLDAQETEKTYQQKLSQVDAEGAQRAKEYLKKAQDQARDLIERTQNENEQSKKRAQADIEQSMLLAKAELTGQLGEMVFGLGSEILGRNVSSQDNQKLIDNAVEKLKDQINE